MNGNCFNLTTHARSSVSEPAITGWMDYGDVIDLVSCLLEGAVELLL